MTAFHTDVLALAQHARTSPNPNVRAAAQRVLTGAHALIAEPTRTEWATALTYDDGETRYRDRDSEQEAREYANAGNIEAIVNDPGSSHPVRLYVVYREVRVLVDGTQITGPWMAPANQFTEGK